VRKRRFGKSSRMGPVHRHDRAVEIAIVLYNVAATIVSIPGGQVGDRRGMVRVAIGDSLDEARRATTT